MTQVKRDFSIVGTTFVGSSDLIKRLAPNNPLLLKREPGNPKDKNAIMVCWGSRRIGYVPRGMAAEIAPLMDAGVTVIAKKSPNNMYGVCTAFYDVDGDAPKFTTAANFTEKGVRRGTR